LLRGTQPGALAWPCHFRLDPESSSGSGGYSLGPWSSGRRRSSFAVLPTLNSSRWLRRPCWRRSWNGPSWRLGFSMYSGNSEGWNALAERSVSSVEDLGAFGLKQVCSPELCQVGSTLQGRVAIQASWYRKGSLLRAQTLSASSGQRTTKRPLLQRGYQSLPRCCKSEPRDARPANGPAG
jgi:hypothetical protein